MIEQKKDCSYDMIMGMDLMSELRIIIDLNEKEIMWEGSTIPLKNHGTLRNALHVQEIYATATIPTVIQEAEE